VEIAAADGRHRLRRSYSRWVYRDLCGGHYAGGVQLGGGDFGGGDLAASLRSGLRTLAPNLLPGNCHVSSPPRKWILKPEKDRVRPLSANRFAGPRFAAASHDKDYTGSVLPGCADFRGTSG